MDFLDKNSFEDTELNELFNELKDVFMSLIDEDGLKDIEKDRIFTLRSITEIEIVRLLIGVNHILHKIIDYRKSSVNVIKINLRNNIRLLKMCKDIKDEKEKIEFFITYLQTFTSMIVIFIQIVRECQINDVYNRDITRIIEKVGDIDKADSSVIVRQFKNLILIVEDWNDKDSFTRRNFY